jgi:hypothetical protein
MIDRVRGWMHGFRCMDDGHSYDLGSLDGEYTQNLRFVKRCEPAKKYPGNLISYPGTTTQMVLRVLVDRLYYLEKQRSCAENRITIKLLKICIWLMEYRAVRMNFHFYKHSLKFATYAPLCRVCGHTQCTHGH